MLQRIQSLLSKPFGLLCFLVPLMLGMMTATTQAQVGGSGDSAITGTIDKATYDGNGNVTEFHVTSDHGDQTIHIPNPNGRLSDIINDAKKNQREVRVWYDAEGNYVKMEVH